MLDLIASVLVKGLNIFFNMMPIRFNLWLGRCFGTLMYVLSGRRGRVTYSNLKAAFCGEKPPRELKRITKSTYRQISQTFTELISMTKMNKRYIDKFVDVRNFERIERAAKNPKGMILVSAHFGNWELSTATSVIKGFPLYVLARDQKMKRLNELLNKLREAKGNLVIRKGADIKTLFRILHDGKSVGLLADQNAGAGGELIDFFGRPASTVTGPYRFAQKSGAWILPAFIHRIKGPYHELVLEPEMVIEKGDDITPYMRQYNRLLEKHIRAHPDQWLWMHKRWKLTPVKKIMVLDDGKKGHLKQSLAVVKQLRRFREDEGYTSDQTEVDVVRIRFKGKPARTLFNAISPFFTPRCQGCLKCLKRALDRESYEAAVSRYADVIISCGSALSGVNKMLKMENYARNLTVLDPGCFNRKRFDLIVIPRHDLSKKRPEGEKVIVTDLAPNLIQEEEMNSLRNELEGAEGDKGERGARIGLLCGGDNPCFAFGNDLARSLAEGIKKASVEIDGHFYVTTSRRTPPAAEAILEKEFTDDPRCVKFISGRTDKDERTVEKILAMSDVVAVSGESISMVSEAVSSGRPVLVFMPDKRTPRYTKYERFVDVLQQRGYVRRVTPEDIPREVAKIVGQKVKFTIPDDDKRIYEKMYRLF